MNEGIKAIMDSAPKSKTFLGKLGKFMLYGGWLLVIILALVLMFVFSHK
jgi:hypothetical protein